MSVINRSPVNTTSGTGYRYWQDEDFTRMEARLMSEGVDMNTSSTALEVTERALGANMSVDVASGYCLVEITRSGRVFKVWVENTATANLAISSNASGSTRYDLVCVKVDTTLDPDTQADNMCSLIIVEGTGGAGVPSTPSNHLKLAEVEVINGAVTIPNAKITDTRVALPALDDIATNTSDILTHDHTGTDSVIIDHYQATNYGTRSYYQAYVRDLSYGTGTGGSYTTGNWADRVSTGTGANYYAYFSGSLSFGLNYSSNHYYSCTFLTASITDVDTFTGLAQWGNVAVNSVRTSVTAHIGFFTQGSTIYASNANGIYQTKTACSATYLGSNPIRLSYKRYSGSIYFYVNGVLQATHTTNLPSGSPESWNGISVDSAVINRAYYLPHGSLVISVL
jgi:hypothetical protein